MVNFQSFQILYCEFGTSLDNDIHVTVKHDLFMYFICRIRFGSDSDLGFSDKIWFGFSYKVSCLIYSNYFYKNMVKDRTEILILQNFKAL